MTKIEAQLMSKKKCKVYLLIIAGSKTVLEAEMRGGGGKTGFEENGVFPLKSNA
jgi:hypothetical protein